jgi:hypothetical protein
MKTSPTSSFPSTSLAKPYQTKSILMTPTLPVKVSVTFAVTVRFSTDIGLPSWDETLLTTDSSLLL